MKEGTLMHFYGTIGPACASAGTLRRLICNLIGQWVEDGEYPNDEKALEKIVKGICFDNAKRYFNL